jgi:short-subunit dehydrogenase
MTKTNFPAILITGATGNVGQELASNYPRERCHIAR